MVGAANAEANAFRIDPRTGSLSLGIAFGQSLADYAGEVGRAQSRSIDLGTLGTTLTSKGCDGGDPTIPPDQAPPTVKADSRDEASRKGVSATYIGQGPIAFGSQKATATEDPKGEATTTIGAFTVPGAIEIGGGTTNALARLVEKKTREAVATATVPRVALGGGAVVLENLRWTVAERSGAGAGHEASFTIGNVSVGGQRLPSGTSEQLKAAIDAANGALAPTGLRIDLPVVEHRETPTGGTTILSPLAIRIVDSPLGRQTIGPALTALQPVRAQLTQALLEASCSFGSPITVADIALSAFGGGGSLSLEVGGANATTDFSSFDNPFLAGAGGGLADVPPVEAPAPDTSTGATAGTFEPAAVGGTPTAGGAPNRAANPSGRSEVAAPISRTTSPSRTRGIVAGLLALGILAGVAGGDFARMRTPSRTIEDPE